MTSVMLAQGREAESEAPGPGGAGPRPERGSALALPLAILASFAVSAALAGPGGAGPSLALGQGLGAAAMITGVILSLAVKRRLDRLGSERDAARDAARTGAEELRESQARLQALLDRARAVVFVKDLNGRYVLANRRFSELAGIPREEILGRSDAELFPPAAAAAFRASDRAALSAVEPLKFDETLTLGGQRLLLVTDKFPLIDDAGAAYAICGISTDVTQHRHAEEALRRAENRLSATFEQAAVGLAHVAIDGRWLRVNRKLCEIVGYDREELLALRFQDITHPSSLDADIGELRRLWEGESESYTKEKRYLRKDGTEVWVNVTVAPVRDPDGAPEYCVSVIKDISAQKRAEQALKDSEAKYRLLFEANPNPMWVFDPETMAFLAVNDAAVRRYGYSRDEMLRMKVTDIRTKEEAERLTAFLREQPETCLLENDSWRHRTKDGTLLDVEISSRFVEFQGRPAWIVMAQDVTERKRVERALRESESRFQLATRATNGLIWDWDITTGAHWCNDAAATLFGYPPEAAHAGIDWWRDHLHPEDRPGVLERLGAFLAGPDQARSDEFRFQRSDGTYATVADRGVVVRDEQGRPTRMIGSLTDVTERKAAVEEIRALNARLQHRLERINSLRTIDKAITAGVDLATTLGVVVGQVTAQLEVDAAAILRLDPQSQTLECAARVGFRTDACAKVRVPVVRQGAGRTVLERRALHLPDLRDSPESFIRAGAFAAEEFVAYHAVPLVAKGEVTGVLEVLHRSPLDPDPEWCRFLESLAAQAAIAMDSAAMFDGLRRANAELRLAYDATIEGWSRALDLRDKETEGHSRRVTEMTVQLARAMGVGEAELVHVRRGALLHDIGKMGIPDRILLKPGPLSEEEWQVMRRHPTYAAEMLQPIEFLRPALDIPRYHHEKWDGTGYPHGLKGEQIPLPARIFAAADIWDALSHDRPYRKAWPQERVREYVRSLAGNALDPRVVKAFLRVCLGSPDALAARPGPDPTAGDAGAGPDLAPSPERTPPAGQARGLSVLVVDDSVPTLRAMRGMLEGMGHAVVTAEDGQEAWEIVRRGDVRVVIADWLMPGLDGLQLCKRIREEPGRPYTYVILASAHAEDGAGLEALSQGVDDFLAKPIVARELAARLQIAGRILAVQEQLLERTVLAERISAELRHQNERLAELVVTDPMTGLSNRRHLLEALEAQAALAERQRQPLSLALLDVDRFKQYNDTFGHRAGDEVLCRIADILREHVRCHDVVARYGGEEFVVLMPATGAEGGAEVAERLRAAIEQAPWPLRQVTASLGIASAPPGEIDPARLVEEADRALYRSKRRGRNRVTHGHELTPGTTPLPV